ncbi:unnamed protein product [Owenia fusiformis]|uniref:Gamma-aminobutyric acid receptor subunit beta n=1 Tax=Owenia fusiformis TaxID=6347 RepID=A0A8S4N8L4_OWEFU|nr:unnamed protein product [Owenia fusiformis]
MSSVTMLMLTIFGILVNMALAFIDPTQDANFLPSGHTSAVEFMNMIENRSLVDQRIRPNHNGPPVIVKCQVFISSFGSISEVNMDYSLDFFLRQEWNDPRLQYEGGKQRYITLTSESIKNIWTPPLYFPNEKKGELHTMIIPNKLIRVTPNGTVTYSIRLTLVLSCPMLLTDFPLDTQECALNIESFVYESDDIELQWQPDHSLKNQGVEIPSTVGLAQFKIDDVKASSRNRSYSRTGSFSSLRAVFHLKRQIGYYLLQTYIPSMLIVILSWVAFWINKEAVPARIALGITTVLTMTTQLTGSRQGVPRVSYPKAMDVWMAACMLFVFLALLEYAVVNVMSTVEKDKQARHRDIETGKKGNKKRDRSSVLAYNKGRGCTAQYVDNCSRIIFPVFFVIFNCAYWAVYTAEFQTMIVDAFNKIKGEE